MPTDLSLAQQRLWFLDQMDPGSPAHHVWAAYRIRGLLDVEALRQSLADIVQRHDLLRTTFAVFDGQPALEVFPHGHVTLPVVDLQVPAEPKREGEAQRLVAEETESPFDLSQGPLLRAKLFRLSQEDHVLALTAHRIVCDEGAIAVLMQELGALYRARAGGGPSPLSERPIQYSDLSQRQRQSLHDGTLASDLDYWRAQLGGTMPALELPTDRPRPPGRAHREARHSTLLSPGQVQALKNVDPQGEPCLSVVLLAAFKALLCRFSLENETAVGTTVSGRHRAEAQGVIGPLSNALVLRTDLSGNPSFRELLERVRGVVVQALDHQELPFEALVQELRPAREPDRPPFFQVGFEMRDPADGRLALPGVEVEPFPSPETFSELDLTLYARQGDEGLELTLAYNAGLYAQERIVELLDQYRQLLAQIVEHPDRTIQSYSLVTAQARRLLPDPTAVLPEPQHPPITTLFASWADRTVEANGRPAIRWRDRTWTYEQLGTSAHALAQALRSHGVERGEVVAVSGARSYGLIAGMVGVLLSGGVLLNLDPHLPRGRQELMLQQAEARTLVYCGTPRAEDKWMRTSLTVLRVDPESGEMVEPAESVPAPGTPLPPVAPEDAAYLFFTSGTTGVPKGVLGCHKGLAHFISWQRHCFAIGPSDRSAQLTGISFDVVLRDIFTPLTSGATLCLPREEDRLEPARLLSWMERERITMLHTVPSLAQVWLAHVPPGVSLRTVRWVFSAGEPLTDTLVQRWREAFPQGGEIVNLYGPTETTMAKCYFVVPPEPLPGVQPVGRTLPETQALVLSPDHRLCGIGEPGEIVIRTPFRTLGYINAPEENQRRFVPNPFREDERDLFYYTGDRGRYRPDGSLDILGRVDHQVKIRGVRIELGGIEAVIRQHPAVWHTVATVREDVPGDKRLVAYVTAQQGQALRTYELRQFLKQRLPDAMVPSAFVILDALPLTPNGKVDRRALPAPEGLRPELEANYVAPRTEAARTIATIWQQVLRIERAGVNDNFFDLGGQSLLLVQVQSKLKEAFDREIPVVELFKHPTIDALSRYLSADQSERPQLEQVQDRTQIRKALRQQQRRSRERSRQQ